MNIARRVKVLAATACACAAILVLTLAGCGAGATAAGADAAKGITVSASSEAKIAPDKARINVSVVSEDDEAEACQSSNAQKVNAVVDALKGLGVADESIQTSYSNLSPRYGSRTSNKNNADGREGETYDEWVITGYEMRTALTVSDLEIDSVGVAVQACVAAGANESDGVEDYASAYDEKYNEALAKALETAKAKAESVASATGASLGKVVNVVEGYQDTSARYVSSEVAVEDDAADAGAAVAKTMPGQVGIVAEVTVTYAIS